MRKNAQEVIDGLRLHAEGQGRSVFSSDLAIAIGLKMRVVSDTLNWLAVNYPEMGVRRRKYNNCKYIYWYEV